MTHPRLLFLTMVCIILNNLSINLLLHFIQVHHCAKLAQSLTELRNKPSSCRVQESPLACMLKVPPKTKQNKKQVGG